MVKNWQELWLGTSGVEILIDGTRRELNVEFR